MCRDSGGFFMPSGMVPDGDEIRSERLELVLLPWAAMDTLIAGEHDRVEAMLGLSVAASFPEEGDLDMLGFRRDQLAATPSWAPWLVRGIVRREDRTMIGLATFHGPPGINDLCAPGAAEVGYTVNKPYRNRGYATETATAMLPWAKREHGISHFVSGIAPDNLSSLRVIHKLGFKPMDSSTTASSSSTCTRLVVGQALREWPRARKSADCSRRSGRCVGIAAASLRVVNSYTFTSGTGRLSLASPFTLPRTRPIPHRA